MTAGRDLMSVRTERTAASAQTRSDAGRRRVPAAPRRPSADGEEPEEQGPVHVRITLLVRRRCGLAEGKRAATGWSKGRREGRREGVRAGRVRPALQGGEQALPAYGSAGARLADNQQATFEQNGQEADHEVLAATGQGHELADRA